MGWTFAIPAELAPYAAPAAGILSNAARTVGTAVASPAGAAVTTAAIAKAAYDRYNKDVERLNEATHYSDRNADRLIRTQYRPQPIGTGRPIYNTILPEVTVTAMGKGKRKKQGSQQSGGQSGTDTQSETDTSTTTDISAGTTANPQPDGKKPEDKKPKEKRPFFGPRTAKVASKLKPFSGYGQGPIINDVVRVAFRDAPIASGVFDATWEGAKKLAEAIDDTQANPMQWSLFKYSNPYGWLYWSAQKFGTSPKPDNSLSEKSNDMSVQTSTQQQTNDNFIQPDTIVNSRFKY